MKPKKDKTYEKRVSNLAKIVILIVNIFSTGGFTAGFLTGKISLAVYGLVLASMIITTIINFYYSAKKPEQFKYVAVWGYAFVYLLSVIYASNDLLFAIMFCIVMVYTLFFDYKLSKAIAIVYSSIIVLDVLLTIFYKKTTHSGEPINPILIFIESSSVIIFLIVLVCVTKIANANNESKISLAQAEAEKSETLLSDVLAIVEKVKENSAKVSDYMDDLTANVEQTSNALKEISAGNDNNTQSIEQQTFMTNKIQEMIETTKGMANGMLSDSAESSKAVSTGREAVQTLTEQAQRNEDANAEVVRTVEKFVESTKLISATTAEISNISSQTNLLALNASIESARAGEAGRGFAVVATEIGTLAAQTNKLTNDIYKVVEGLNADVENAKRSVATVIEVTEAEKELIGKANQEFDNIGSSVNSLSNNISKMASQIDEIYSANNNIVESITNISAVSEEVTASTTDAVSLGEKCADNAVEVNALMKELSDVVQSVNA